MLFEDADLLVVNKAAGVVIQPGRGWRYWSGTLAHAALAHCCAPRPGDAGGGGAAGAAGVALAAGDAVIFDRKCNAGKISMSIISKQNPPSTQK